MEVTYIPSEQITRDTTSTVAETLTGAIPRLEDRSKQLAFARAAGLEVVMLDIYRAERLLDKGKCADSLFPDAFVVLTTTFEDERLELWFLNRQVQVAVEFGADAIVPCDCPIYETDPRQQRLQDVRLYAENVARAIEKFDKHNIAVIPLVKGDSTYERRVCYEVFRQYGITYVAFYCAQYFLYGYQYPDLLTRVREMVYEFDPEGMMLIGLQSENLLSDFPPAVCAAAGQRWFWQSALKDESLAVAQRNYREWEREVETALRISQTQLGSFIEQSTYGGI